MHSYEIRVLSEAGDCAVFQLRDGGKARQVDEQHQGYQAWLATGKRPDVKAFIPPDPPTLDDAKAAKLREIAAARYIAETGGIVVAGVEIRTDREAQAMLTAAAMSAQLDPAYTCWWKGANGWAQLDAKTLLLIGGAVREHVQKCFDRERVLTLAVDAAKTVPEVEAVQWDE